MMNEDTIAKIAAAANGAEVIAYRRVTADADDHRYVVAYGFGAGVWMTAVWDTATITHLGGTSHRDPITPGNVGLALEREQADARKVGA